jgi:hypothetical protein
MLFKNNNLETYQVDMYQHEQLTAWTEDEKKSYEQLSSRRLDSLYKNANIPRTEPEKRAQYLMERVLELTTKDQDLINQIVVNEGRDRALNILEQMVLAKH